MPSYTKRLVIFLLVVFLGLALNATRVNACSCGPRPTVLEAFDESEVVIIARIISVERVSPKKDDSKTSDKEQEEEEDSQPRYVDGIRSATMVVNKVFKGKLKIRDEIVFGQGNGADCIWTFDEDSVGDEVLLYLTTPETLSKYPYLPSKDPGLWFAFGCGRNRGIAGAIDDLSYLKNMSKLGGRTRISGTLGDWNANDFPVEGKTIKIIGPKKTYVTKTDKNGFFEIYDLPPGKYLVEPEVPAGWKVAQRWLEYAPSVMRQDQMTVVLPSPNQVPILLEPKKHAGVDLSFEVDNEVRGKVIGPGGKGMEGVCVYLWRLDQKGGYGPFNCTDEKGQFAITSIPEGQYVMVANNDGEISTREPFGRLYYPNVTDRERAAIISIAAGERLAGFNIVVPKLETLIKLEGVLLYSDGKPVAEEWVKFKSTKSEDNVSGDVREQTDSTGRFSLKVLKGISGELSGENWIFQGQFKNCPKADELLATNGGRFKTVKSNTIKVEAEHDLFNLELVLPMPLCEKVKK